MTDFLPLIFMSILTGYLVGRRGKRLAVGGAKWRWSDAHFQPQPIGGQVIMKWVWTYGILACFLAFALRWNVTIGDWTYRGILAPPMSWVVNPQEALTIPAMKRGDTLYLGLGEGNGYVMFKAWDDEPNVYLQGVWWGWCANSESCAAEQVGWKEQKGYDCGGVITGEVMRWMYEGANCSEAPKGCKCTAAAKKPPVGRRAGRTWDRT